MSVSLYPPKDYQDITPPLSFSELSLVSKESEGEPTFTQASRVLKIFKLIESGNYFEPSPWIEFQFIEGEYEELERWLSQDIDLFGFVSFKIRYASQQFTGSSSS